MRERDRRRRPRLAGCCRAPPASNFGTDSNLKVDGKSGNTNARALVRFTLPAIPAGCQVTGATLRLYAASYKENRTLQAQRAGGDLDRERRHLEQPAGAPPARP